MSSENITIGNYHILSTIASGAFGRVYLARHSVLTNRTVALKMMHGVPLSTKQAIEHFLNEAKILELLHHPYILSILDVGIHEGIPYLVSEYAAGNSLRMRLNKSFCSPEASLLLLSQVGQALDYAHRQNIIHRDLKPENILFNAKGDALLADFGLATMLTTASVEYVSNGGTPQYMAPEQCYGAVSKESDQYALGCIAYELFTGHPPFNGPGTMALMYQHVNESPLPLRTYNTHIPLYIEQAVLKALRKQRSERYRNVADFLAALSPATITQLNTSQSFTTTVSTQIHLSKNIDFVPIQMPEQTRDDQAFRMSTSGSRSLPQISRANQAHLPIDVQEFLSTYVPTDTILLPQKNVQKQTPSHASIPPSQTDNSLHNDIDRSHARRSYPAYRKFLVALSCLLIVGVVSGSLFWIYQPSQMAKKMGTGSHAVLSATSTVVSPLAPTVSSPPPTSIPTATIYATPTYSGTPSVTTTPTVTTTSQPILTVNQASENANTDCSYDATHGWVCPLSLHNSQSTQQNLTWKASTQSSNVVGFSQTGGTLSPGQTISIKVLISNVSCPTTLFLSFSGPENKVSVPWHCAAPTLTVSPSDLGAELNSCLVISNIYQCAIYLNVSGSSQGGLNWSSSGTEYVCDMNGCSTGQLGGNVITPSNGSIVSSANYEQVTVTVPICQHESIKDTMVFSGPSNSATVTYSCNSSS